ncbi:MAG: endonuclease [Bacteroides sp.]|nr:endonuclease [Bacteroides sp.]MCM1086253.1 endonuclease [Bacteroides sp.]
MKKVVGLLLLFCLVWVCRADEPEGYYDAALHKKGIELKETLFGIINEHTKLTYKALWDAYLQTDADADSNIIDIYNECPFKFRVDQHSGGSSGSKTNQCLKYNREHSFPKSWFHETKEGSPMYTDLFHLYPVSGYVNSRRNNNPFGEVANPEETFTGGSKLGNCTFPGYTGTVYEPLDQYKGDLARTYFYMATCYHDKIATWTSDMLAGNNQDDFTEWSKELLLKWHLQDTVSEKERRRNDSVFKIQGNRNPFIDHPELVEKIWGDDTVGWGDTALEPNPTPGDTVDIQNPFWNKCSVTVSNRFLQIDYSAGQMESVEIFNTSGSRICATFVRQSRFGYRLPAAGIYIVRIGVGKRQFTRKVAVL